MILKFFENLQYKVADKIGVNSEGNLSYFEKNENFSKKIEVLKLGTKQMLQLLSSKIF